MKKLTKENWLEGHEECECFWVQYQGRMVSDTYPTITTCESEYYGMTTLKEARHLFDAVVYELKKKPYYDPVQIVATALNCGDYEDDFIDEYLDKYGNDTIIIDEFD